MAMLRDEPNTLKEARELIESLNDYTLPASWMHHRGTTQMIVNTPDEAKGVQITLDTGLDSQWLDVCEFTRHPYSTREKRLRITRPTAAKIKQMLIDRYAPDYHPDKKA